ncbi:hypothetical protein J7J95_03655 [bacterium]|nr:hypothetical protein [bacterium]
MAIKIEKCYNTKTMNAETSPEEESKRHLIDSTLTYLLSSKFGPKIANALTRGESPQNPELKKFTDAILDWYNKGYSLNPLNHPLVLAAGVESTDKDPTTSILKELAPQCGFTSDLKNLQKRIQARISDRPTIIVIRREENQDFSSSKEDPFKQLAKSLKGKVVFESPTGIVILAGRWKSESHRIRFP